MIIVKNTTNVSKNWGGIDISALGQYTLQEVDVVRFLSDEVFKSDAEAGDAVISDGFNDLGVVDGVMHMQGYLPPIVRFLGVEGNQVGVTPDNRLKMDVQFSADQLLKVSSNDQTAGYLEQKLTGISGETTEDVINEGGAEVRRIGLPNVGTAGSKGSANNVPVFTTDAKGRVTGSTNTPITGVPAANIVNTPSGNIAATNVQTALNELDSEKQALSEKAQANGYASLDGSGKVPVAQLPDTVVGSVDYKGTWDASTNSPNLVTATPDKGDYYVVNVAGSTSLGGITDWQVGDWAIYNGSAWQKVDNTDQVSSVFGRQGTVTAQAGDYTAAQVTNIPAGNISATNVQAAINELDTEKEPLITAGTTAQYRRGDKTWQDLATAVRAVALTGISFASSIAITATDTVLNAFGKLQAQITTLFNRNINAGTGLTGGGNLTADRTISMPNVGTAGIYGSSSQVPVITTDAQGRVSGVTPTTVDKLYDHWNNTTQYTASQLRIYTRSATTDGNGRITVYLTQNGLVGGTALFSSIFSVNCTGLDGSGTAIQAPLFIVESLSGVTLVLRAVRGTSTGVLLGGTVISMQFAGSGYTGYITVMGAK